MLTAAVAACGLPVAPTPPATLATAVHPSSMLSRTAVQPSISELFPSILLADDVFAFADAEEEDCYRPLKKREALSKTCEFEVKKAEMRERTAKVEAEAELKLAMLERQEAGIDERQAKAAARDEANAAAVEAVRVAGRADGATRGFETPGMAMPSLPKPSLPSLRSGEPRPVRVPASPTPTGPQAQPELGAAKAACFWCG